jgi:signal transduction histidine kinase
LARLRKGLADTIGGLGRLARGLHPSALDDLGLGPALRRHAADTAEALGIPIRVTIKGLGTRRLANPIETALYRIAQEALSNVVRHSGAKTVDIKLMRGDAMVRLVVSDDGRGFDQATPARGARPPRSLGLLGIKERAAALGGAGTIASVPGRGTTVTVVLPLPAGTSRARRQRRTARRHSR